eukprot:7371031-Pyramimonas_sp.AAC.1
MAAFYSTLHATPPPPALAAVAVHAGERDVQVPRWLATPPGVVQDGSPGGWIAASSLAAPGVWASADHQQIVWCNQMCAAAASFLLDAASMAAAAVGSRKGLLESAARRHFPSGLAAAAALGLEGARAQ